jgi:hypothetical protein
MKTRGGRLLIVGGQKNQFNLVQAVFQMAEAAGIGEAQAALPDALRRAIGEAGFAWFVPTSTSGSLGKAALGELLHHAADFDALVLGANLTTNAETGIMIERLLREYEGRVIITEEAIRILKFEPSLITGNPRVLVVATMSGLFELANNHHVPLAIKPNRGVVGKIEVVQQVAAISRCAYCIFDSEIIVTTGDSTSLTALTSSLSDLPAITIGVAATFWLQQPSQPYEALTTAAFVIREAVSGKGDPTYSTAAKQIREVLSRV